MANRILLWENNEKQVPDGIVTRDLDREDLIKRCIAYGIAPVKVEFEFQEGSFKETVWIHFLPEDLEPFEQKYFAQNKELFTSIRMQTYANDWWKDLLVAAKSKRRWIESQRSTA